VKSRLSFSTFKVAVIRSAVADPGFAPKESSGISPSETEIESRCPGAPLLVGMGMLDVNMGDVPESVEGFRTPFKLKTLKIGTNAASPDGLR
jgi:hypothetical protein